MEKQMRAERDKRAAILNAEGEKQSQILTAEGQRQAAILKAEGDKQSKILRAQGDAEATKQVFAAIHEGNPTPDLLAYQYLQTLPNVDGLKLLLIPSDGLSAMSAVASLGAAFQTGAEAAKTDGAGPPTVTPTET
jgi:regulator of protease activity HflC (stomatin/prohibitin superfamily)